MKEERGDIYMYDGVFFYFYMRGVILQIIERESLLYDEVVRKKERASFLKPNNNSAAFESSRS